MIFKKLCLFIILCVFGLSPRMIWAVADDSKPLSKNENPFWIQVVNPDDQTEMKSQSHSDFGFKFQRAVFQASSELSFSQSLLMGCLFYRQPIFLTDYRYKVSVWLGESPIESVQNSQYLGSMTIVSRFYGLEFGFEKEIWKNRLWRLVPGIALRSQLVTQMIRFSQLPAYESWLTLPNVYLGLEYLARENLGLEMIVAYDDFFRTQFQVGVFRRW